MTNPPPNDWAAHPGGHPSTWPPVEVRHDRARREWNLLVRRPFYLCYRVGLTQNALWVGRVDRPCHTLFNVVRKRPVRS